MPRPGLNRDWPDIQYSSTDQTAVPVACPIRWSATDFHGHSRTAWQAFRPGSMHVQLIGEEP
jgi:hypothetical protein